MRTELLEIPERRATVLPELAAFFTQHGQTPGRQMLAEFVRVFSGTELNVPGPEVLRLVERDESIIDALEKDCSVQAQVDLMVTHGVHYQYMATIWSLCTGRRLEPAGTSCTAAERIAQAADLAMKHPKILNDVVSLFAMSAKERAELQRVVDHRRGVQPREEPAAGKKSPMRPLSDIQRQVLVHVPEGKDVHRDELRRIVQATTAITKTLMALQGFGYLRVSASGKIKLTRRGAEAKARCLE